MNFKTLSLVGILGFISLITQAQLSDNLNNKKDYRPDFLVSVGLEPSIGAYHYMLFADVELGIRINKSYEFGGYYSSSLNGYYPYGYERDMYKNYFDHGGIWLGYIFEPEKIIHPFLRIKSGTGNFAYSEIEYGQFFNLPCFVVQPSAGFECSINKYLKFSMEVYYRYASSLDIYLYKDDNAGGTGLNLRLTGEIPSDSW